MKKVLFIVLVGSGVVFNSYSKETFEACVLKQSSLLTQDIIAADNNPVTQQALKAALNEAVKTKDAEGLLEAVESISGTDIEEKAYAACFAPGMKESTIKQLRAQLKAASPQERARINTFLQQMKNAKTPAQIEAVLEDLPADLA